MRVIALLASIVGVLSTGSVARADIVYCEHYGGACWRCGSRFPTATPASIGPCPIPGSCMPGQMCMRSTATAMWCSAPASDECVGMPTPCAGPIPRCGLEYGVEFCVWTCAPDAGVAAADAGPGRADSGIVASDAGVTTFDSGIVASDAGVMTFDSGRATSDAATGDSDARVGPPDAGAVVGIDAAGGELDAASTGERDASAAPTVEPVRFAGGGGCVCHASTSRWRGSATVIVPALLALWASLRRRARR